ncbi:acetyltransferase [Aureococcus anophagefferens]|nr:acetyltransferase [Aureococcus anophagefferens]
MLSHFKPRGYKVRHARPSDLTRCLELEAKSWDPDMRTAASTVERRFEALPTCNFVMTRDDVVVGVVFFQFLDDVDALLRSTWKKKDALGKESGPRIQLLDIFVDSQVSSTMGGSIGQELRDFVMCYACVLRNVTEICGVTRARNFRAFADKGETYETYCLRNNGVHDSGLALHSRAGATLHKVVHNWRPEDGDNDGNGVYMSYAVGRGAARRSRPRRQGDRRHAPPKPLPNNPLRIWKAKMDAGLIPPPEKRLGGRQKVPQRVVHPEPYMFDEMAKCDLLAIPMYLQHGFCLLSICSAMADLDVNITLWMHKFQAFNVRELSEKLELRPGYCTPLINSPSRRLHPRAEHVGRRGPVRGRHGGVQRPHPPPYEPIADYLKFDFAPIFRDDADVFPTMDLQGPKILKMQLLLEGFYLAPIVIYLRMHLHPSSAIFRRLDWLDKGTMKLTYKGTYVLAAALNAGVPISYYPMFQELPKILKGDGSIFAAQEADGHEVHVDRVLNVTKRGKHLDKHPLTLIGVDFNDESPRSRRRRRAGVPFEVQWGDIGDPAFVVEALEKKGYARDPCSTAVAAELLNFLLCYARPLGERGRDAASSARRFKTAPKIGDGSFEDYVFTDNGAHDPALALHAAAGAKVQAIVDDWWPEDGDNGGRGAYATYVVGAPPFLNYCVLDERLCPGK